MAAVPTTEPVSIVSGDTITWSKSLSDYKSTLWTLKYEIVSSTQSLTVACTNGGNGSYLATISATANILAAGDYSIVGYVNDLATGIEKHTVYTGRIHVSPDLSIGASDVRSHAKRVLDAIEATIEGRATRDQRTMRIGGRWIERMPVEELIRLRSVYRAEFRAEVSAERIANGLPSGRKIVTRFVT